MSYEVSIVIDTGSKDAIVEEVGDITLNVGGMFRLALGTDLRDFDGLSCESALPVIQLGVQHIRDPMNRAAYETMNPTNGWGTHGGAAEFLERLCEAAERHPKAKIDVT